MERQLERKPELPEDLQPDNYEYPAALFNDYEIEQEDSDEPLLVPVEEEEEALLMAQYAVVQALRLATASDRMLKLARNEVSSNFMSGILKVKRSRVSGDLESGDIELQAEELGVYELIWPFDSDKMQKAIKAERDPQGDLTFSR